MHSAKHWISILIGLLLMALGILPLLSQLGIIGLAFDTWIGKIASIFAYIIAAGGLYLIIDSFHEIGSMAPTLGWITLIVGVIVLAFGIIQALHSFGTISWQIPTLPEVVYYAIFIFEGILLFIAGFLD